MYLTASGLSCSKWDLVPRPGSNPGHPALGARTLSHRTTREVLMTLIVAIISCPGGSSKVSDTLLWIHSPFSRQLCHCWAFCPILAPCDQLPHSLPFRPHKCHLPTGPLPKGQGCTAPSLYTRYHSEGLVHLSSPFSCNYVEQTRAADGKEAAIKQPFGTGAAGEEMGRLMGGGF